MAKVLVTELREKWKLKQKLMLAKTGFDVDRLTQDQIDAILLPSEAPENYYCDGELNAEQALTKWLELLDNVGLDSQNIGIAKAMME